MYLAYLTLLSGLLISLVGEYFSILGLMTIFSAAPLSAAVMGISLGIGKIISTIWLKQNWKTSPFLIKLYLLSAILILMLITSIGCFGLLSKAHSDQSLVSGDVIAKISVYDEKIKTAKENIDANRKALKQLDEAVDQIMGRSTTETGADKAVQIRRSQSKERARLLQEIEAEQKKVSRLNEERAPIAAEVRKVEAEVGPVKYIAAFIYGETDQAILEKAVTWIIITIIFVFDPLAVILLLASQISFDNIRKRSILITTEGDSPEKESDVISTATVTEPVIAQKVSDVIPKAVVLKKVVEEKLDLEKYPYLTAVPERRHPPGVDPVGPLVYKEEPAQVVNQSGEEPLFVQNEEQAESNVWSSTVSSNTNTNVIDQKEYIKAAIEKRERLIEETVKKVKEHRMSMSDVPVDILHIVKSRV